jgi:hypothetical protein
LDEIMKRWIGMIALFGLAGCGRNNPGVAPQTTAPKPESPPSAIKTDGDGKPTPIAKARAKDTPFPEFKDAEFKPTRTMAMTAEEFHKAVKEGMAGMMFRDAAIELTGTIRMVGSDGKDCVITLEAGTSALGVSCQIVGEKEPWARLARGQKIKLRGQFPAFFADAALVNCTLVELGPSTAVQAKAEDLAAEFAKDKEATVKKYREKTVIIAGVVESKRSNDLGAIKVILKSAGPVRTQCGFTAFEKAEAEKLQPGERVRIVGEFSALESLNEPVLLFCRVISQ